MPEPTPGKVSLHVELLVEEPGRAARRIRLAPIPTPLRDPIVESARKIDHPTPSRDDTCVTTVSGELCIEADGTVPTGPPPTRVWARCFPDPALTSTTMGFESPVGHAAVSVVPSSGTWAFHKSAGPLVPGAQANNVPGGADNNTLFVWFEYATSPPFVVETTPFHGLNPGFGQCASVVKPLPSPPTAAIVHATFTGALAELATVALDATALGWSALVPPAGILSFLPIGSDLHLLLLGLTTMFDTTGEVVSTSPYVWQASGVAVGLNGGPFEVTVTE